MDFDLAAEFGIDLIGKLMPLHGGDVININIPPLSQGRPKGLRVVPQATSGFHEYYVPQKAGGGETVFQLAGGDHRREDLPADASSLVEGYITLTALLSDMTDHAKTTALARRLTDVNV
jgi:broad specificity polyphosphatase/5'/3'-nucleotidase SurE